LKRTPDLKEEVYLLLSHFCCKVLARHSPEIFSSTLLRRTGCWCTSISFYWASRCHCKCQPH